MARDLKTYSVGAFQGAIAQIVRDVEALSHEDLDRTWGKASRTGYDVAYEVGVITDVTL